MRIITVKDGYKSACFFSGFIFQFFVYTRVSICTKYKFKNYDVVATYT